ncbi:DMT family transporter [Geodermatophilus sp. SYSU D00815]
MRPSRSPADLVLIAVAAVWGSSYLAAKVLVGPVGVAPVLALRFLLATAVLVVVVAARRRRPTRADLTLGLLLGGTQAAVLALETAGVARTSATNAGLLIGLTVLVTPVVEGLVTGRRLPAAFFGAGLLAVVGVALLGDGFRAPSAGDALVLAAAVVRAGHVTALGRLTTGRDVDTWTLTLVQSAVCAAAFALADPRGLAAAATGLDRAQWVCVAWLALACSVFAFAAQLWAVRRTSASRAGLLLGTEPVWAVAVGLGLGGESLGVLGAVGAVLVVAATSWGRRVESRHRAGARQAADGPGSPAREPGPVRAVPVSAGREPLGGPG